jgi:hypothetical protein
MEPRPSEESSESRSEVQTSPTRHPERKRRFQIVKLEERIAPGGNGNGNGSNAYCGKFSHKYPCGGGF